MAIFDTKKITIHRYDGTYSQKTDRFEVLAKIFFCDKIDIQDEKFFYDVMNEEIENVKYSGLKKSYDFTKVSFSYNKENFFINKTIEVRC